MSVQAIAGQIQGAGIQAGMNTGIQADAGTAKQAKLAEAAQKFEGMMLEEMLKPMQKAGSVGGGGFGGFGGDEDDDAGRDGSLDTLSSYGVEAMAEALAKGGGLGLAKQIVRQIGKVDERGKEKSSSTKV
jgi:flagellar protein FlgJ